jgi:uncharacterized protein YdhG (YjbR/CyaY superfamily)
MKSKKAGFTSMDEYIAAFPAEVQQKLEEVRATIKAAFPDAKERISYQMPAFELNGKNFVHFSAWKTHIGMYPMPAGTAAFQKEAAKYKGEKSTLKFPLDKPLPRKLIVKVAKYRVAENLKSAEKKSSAKK